MTGQADETKAGAIGVVERILTRFQDTWNWREVADDVLSYVGEGFDVDRVYLFQTIDGDKTGLAWRFITDWMAPGVRLSLGDIFTGEQPVDESEPEIADWADRCRRGEALTAHASQMTGTFRAGYDALQIKSFLSIPIHLNRRWWGHIGIADCRHEREFTSEERSTLWIVARLFADAIEMSGSAIALSEQTRNAITEALPDGIILVDELGAIADVNPAAEKILGEAKSALISQRFFPRLGFGDTPADKLPKYGQRIETSIPRPDGKSVEAEVILTAVTAGERRLVAASLRDLTAIKAAENEIERQRSRLHAAERDAALGSLLAGVAHELNNPLAVVVAQTTLLEAKLEDSPHAERISKIRAAADRCGRIIKGFLAMAKRAAPSRQTTAVDDLVRAAVEMTAYGNKSAGIKLHLSLAGNLPDIPADPDQLTQVVANLVINAQQAMLNQTGARDIFVSTRRDSDGAILVTVEDNGPGVAEELKSRIFDPYFTTKPVGAGTGIGLSVSRSMVIAHGGSLELDDREPHGARFVVRLPVADAPAAPVAAPGPRPTPRVLIVDDEEDVGSSLADILDMLGASTTVVNTIEEALAAEPADIICSDLRMPGGGGLALYRQLVAVRPDLKDHFILVTGDTVSAASEVAAAGFSGVIRILEKPFTIPDVRRIWAEVTNG